MSNYGHIHVTYSTNKPNLLFHYHKEITSIAKHPYKYIQFLKISVTKCKGQACVKFNC